MNESSIIFGLPIEVARILIPTIVTIILFFLGFMISWTKKKFEKFSEIKSYRELILEWVNLAEKPIEKQIERCKDFSIRVGSSQELQPEILEYNNFLIEKIETIPIERYINTFVINSRGVKKDKYTKTYNLISQFDYINRAQKEMLSYYEKYHEYCNELLNEWNSNFINLDKIVVKRTLYNKANAQEPKDNFHDQVLKIVVNWGRNSSNGQSSIANSKINLIEPLVKLVDAELKDHPMNDYAYNLDASLQGLEITLKKIKENNSGNCILFESISHNMRESLSTLKNAKDFFKNKTKLRFVLNLK